jgi:hypothetical protein
MSDIRAATAWWRANRPAAPDLLPEELRQAFRLLLKQPHIGAKSLDGDASAPCRVPWGQVSIIRCADRPADGERENNSRIAAR